MSLDVTLGGPVTAYIGGTHRLSEGETIAAINPSTGDQIGNFPVGTCGDVNEAVASARGAFNDSDWRRSPTLRKQLLGRIGEAILKNSAALDRIDAEDMGKPIGLGTANAAAAGRLTQFYAEAVDKLAGDVFASGEESLVLERRVPHGVVGAITPWNFPCMNAMRKVAPALAAGNCIVLKPSELASRSALAIARIATEAGLPPGVLNVVPGLGRTVGDSLANHMGVDLITFTGSTTAGKAILAAAAQSNMKPVVAECGGKSPQIIFNDGADLDGAAIAAARSILVNSGQVCSAGTRLVVERSIASDVVDRIIAHLQQAVIGDARNKETTFGPLASASQFDRVMGYIQAASRAGLRIATGGHRAKHDDGFFVEPTIFVDVPAAAPLAQEEIFGPVLAVIPFDSEEEAIAIANGTIYGLMAYLWTADLSRGLRVAKAIQSPVIVNASASAGEGAGYAFSFEPFGQSGVGVEGGMSGMATYLRRHGIWINHG